MTTTTISEAQHAATVERVREHGLEDRVDVLHGGLPRPTGIYSKLVSVEMIEAVGWQYFDTFFQSARRCWRPTGDVLQAIMIDDRAYEVEKAAKSFVNTVIFPGGCLPSHEVIAPLHRQAHRHAHRSTSRTSRRTTPRRVRRWRERFAANATLAEELGYDLRFRRMWDLYLAWWRAASWSGGSAWPRSSPPSRPTAISRRTRAASRGLRRRWRHSTPDG